MEGKAMIVLELLLMVALVMGQPGSNTPPAPQTPGAIPAPNPPTVPGGLPSPAIPGSDQLLPGGGMLPPGGGLVIPGDDVVPPPFPGDGVVPPLIPGGGIIPPFIPGIGIDLPKRKCVGKCALLCQRFKRNRFAAKICAGLCMLRCGIRMSNVVYNCTENCAHSVSPISVSGTYIISLHFFSFIHTCNSTRFSNL